MSCFEQVPSNQGTGGEKIDTSSCSWSEDAMSQSNSGAKGSVLPTESWSKATCPARQNTASLTWDSPRFLLSGMKGSSLLQLVRGTKTTDDNGDVGHLHPPQQTRERMKVAKVTLLSGRLYHSQKNEDWLGIFLETPVITIPLQTWWDKGGWL